MDTKKYNRFKKEVELALHRQKAYHLRPMFGSVSNIPEQIYEYDNSFFVAFNTNTGGYEVHSLNHYPETHALDLPFPELDRRALRHLWRNDLRVHGWDIFRRIEDGEQKAEKRKEREMKNWIQDVAGETKGMFAHDAWL